MMEERLKQRLIGAAVLFGTGVIFIPMLLDNSGVSGTMTEHSNIPPRPTGGFSSRFMPLNGEHLEIQKPKIAAQPKRMGERSSDSTAISVKLPEELADSKQSLSEGDWRQAQRGEEGLTSLTDSPPANKRAGVTAWAIQLGSFTSEENAMALQARLRKHGYNAFVEKIYVKDSKVLRVRVGPELLPAKAKELQARLEQDINLKGIMVRYP